MIAGIIVWAIKKKSVQVTENKLGRQVVSAVLFLEREKQFTEFEKLFREQQDDIKKIAEELVNQKYLIQKNYVIVFDENWYSSINLKNFLKILYSNNTFNVEGDDKIVEVLNENVVLKDGLNSIIEKGVIIEISACTRNNGWILEFVVDTKFTPFIIGNNGVVNAFNFCEGEGMDQDNYHKKIEDNWYLWISPAPE